MSGELFLICNYITNSMDQSPSCEANSHSVGQETPCLLWNLNIHYCVNKRPSLVSILSQMHPVHHTFPSSFPKIHSSIIFQSMQLHMKTYGEVEVQLHTFITLALGEGEWSASCPGKFIPKEKASSTNWIEGLKLILEE